MGAAVDHLVDEVALALCGEAEAAASTGTALTYGAASLASRHPEDTDEDLQAKIHQVLALALRAN